MSDILWEPQSVADLASQLSRIGNEYRSAIAEIYVLFNNVGVEQKWTGKNYNVIANEVLNASRGAFESWANYLQNTIPQTVYQIAEMQANIGGGSVSFSLAQSSMDISNIQSTVEKADGSMILEANVVRQVVNSEIPSYSENATTRLQDYYNQFQELGTLNGNAAILQMYNELEEIINKSKAILNSFQDQVNQSVEKSIQKVEITDEETVRMASNISYIMNQ